MDNSVHAVAMSVLLNLLIFTGQIVVYGLLLAFYPTSRVLAPRLRESERPQLENLFWGWAVKAWRHRKRLYVEDLDGTIMVRFCVLGLKFSAAGSFFACILIPIYNAGGGTAEGFNNFHISKLEKDTENFWVVVVVAYLLTALFLHLLAVEWHSFIKLKKRHFERLAQGKAGPGAAQAQRSILVEIVPEDFRAQDGSGVRRFFEEQLFPDHGVRSCVLQADTRQLHKDPAAIVRGAGRVTVLQLRQVLGLDRMPDSLEDGVAPVSPQPREIEEESKGDSNEDASPAALARVVGKGTMVKLDVVERARRARRCCCLEALESALHAALEMAFGFVDRTLQAAEVVQDLSIGQGGSQTAFVTLRSVADRVIAEQVVLSHSGCWLARAAPEARDIIWRNAAVPLTQRRSRTFLSNMALILGLVFWSAPVGTLQVWTSLDDGSANKWFKDTVIGRLCYTFLREYLPVLALLGLQFALPRVFRFLARDYEGYKVKSDILRKVLAWNFRYQFVTLYITVICGTVSLSFHDQLAEVAQHPEKLFEILRKEVPQVACYFINYVCARVGITVPMQLFFPLLTTWKTGGDPLAPVPPVFPDFSQDAANLGLILLLGLTYCVIAPAIMPVCMVFFALSFVVYLWLFSFVYTPEFDCGGGCWYELFNNVMIGLLLGTLSLAGLASAFVAFHSVEFYSLLVLSAVVVAFHYYYHCYFAIPSRWLSLEDASTLDRKCEASDVDLSALLRADYYIDPIIKDAGEPPRAFAPRETSSQEEKDFNDAQEVLNALEDACKFQDDCKVATANATDKARQASSLDWVCRWWEGCLPGRRRREGRLITGVLPPLA